MRERWGRERATAVVSTAKENGDALFLVALLRAWSSLSHFARQHTRERVSLEAGASARREKEQTERAYRKGKRNEGEEKRESDFSSRDV